MGFRSAFNGIPPSSITQDLLADGSVTGTKLSADAIDGKTITGAFIRTDAAGKRWELSSTPSNQLRGYSGLPAEQYYGRLNVDGLDTGDGNPSAAVYLSPPVLSTTPGLTGAYLNLIEYLTSKAIAELGGPRVRLAAGVVGWKVELDDTAVTIGRYTDTDQSTFFAGATQAYMRDPSVTTGGRFVRCDGTNVTVNGAFDQTAGGLNGFKSSGINSTTSTGTAVQINTSNGILFKASSGLRYKLDVRRLRDVLAAEQAVEQPQSRVASFAALSEPTAPAGDLVHPARGRVLDIEPIIYRDRHEVEQHEAGDPDWTAEPRQYIGWAADDFAAAGWEELISRDPETGEPDYLYYERVLAVVVLELQAELADLRARLDALGG